MPFIGNKPTAVPLSANDLEDNIISTAKIQDNAVTPAKYIEPVPFRNIIINGDMSIAQRGTSSAGLGNGNTGYHTVDRWKFVQDGSPTYQFTMSQDTDVPSGQGFAKSLKLDITTAQASLSSSSVFIIEQPIEGQNLQYLKKGTANAESWTLSFWVKSNKTGSFALSFRDVDNSRRNNNLITINSANTWEKKTLTINGDTTGVFDNDNGSSLNLQFWLDSGSTYNSGTQQSGWVSQTNADINAGNTFTFADSTSNYLNITGVQLEAGTSASDFEFLPVDVNLQRCYRYYFTHVLGYQGGYGKKAGINTTFAYLESSFYPVPMRASASMSSGTPTFENCSNLVFNSFAGTTYLCRVTSDNTSPYRAYETTVEHDAEL